MRMHFDGTIQLGTILNLIGVLVGVAVLYGRLVTIETKLNTVWEWFTTHVIQGIQGPPGERGPRGRPGGLHNERE